MFVSGFLGFVWFPSKEGGCSKSDFAIPRYFFVLFIKRIKHILNVPQEMELLQGSHLFFNHCPISTNSVR